MEASIARKLPFSPVRKDSRSWCSSRESKVITGRRLLVAYAEETAGPSPPRTASVRSSGSLLWRARSDSTSRMRVKSRIGTPSSRRFARTRCTTFREPGYECQCRNRRACDSQRAPLGGELRNQFGTHVLGTCRPGHDQTAADGYMRRAGSWLTSPSPTDKRL